MAFTSNTQRSTESMLAMVPALPYSVCMYESRVSIYSLFDVRKQKAVHGIFVASVRHSIQVHTTHLHDSLFSVLFARFSDLVNT